MNVLDPQNLVAEITPAELKQHQSVHQALTGNIDMGSGTGTAPSSSGVNAGVYTQFNKGNGSGTLIRIAANGVVDTGADYNWPASGPLVINHKLLRKPIGWHIVDSDGTSNIKRTAPPDLNQITLETSDNTVSNTVYVF